MNQGNPPDRPDRPPLQFGLRALLAAPVVIGLVFGTLRWLGVSPFASTVVLLILAGSAAAALALVVAIARATDDL